MRIQFGLNQVIYVIGAGLILLTIVRALRPPEWQVVDGGTFQFRMPANLVAMPVHGVDSFVAEFGSANIYFSLDYGMFSNTLSVWQGPVETNNINGEKVKIGTVQSASRPSYNYSASLYANKLNLYAEYKQPGDLVTVLKIFSSLKFDRSKQFDPHGIPETIPAWRRWMLTTFR